MKTVDLTDSEIRAILYVVNAAVEARTVGPRWSPLDLDRVRRKLLDAERGTTTREQPSKKLR